MYLNQKNLDKKVYNLFIGKLLKRGQRAKAEKVFFDSLKALSLAGEKDPVKTFNEGLSNVIPLVEIKSKKVGGTVYRIPIEVSEKRGLSLGVGWLLDSVKSVKKGKLSDRLSNEILLAKQGQGKTIERVRELHSFAQKNRGLVKFL